jgi:hypothetical protein
MVGISDSYKVAKRFKHKKKRQQTNRMPHIKDDFSTHNIKQQSDLQKTGSLITS